MERVRNPKKTHLAVDSEWEYAYNESSCRDMYDIAHVWPIVANYPTTNIFVAVKGYDCESQGESVRDNNVTPVIPCKGNSVINSENIDWCMYRYRHLIENAFARIK